jgi:hypothetical protein
MSNVIPFAPNKKPERPAGMIDVFPEQNGMVLIDACVPAAVLSALLALMGTAGVPITLND